MIREYAMCLEKEKFNQENAGEVRDRLEAASHFYSIGHYEEVGGYFAATAATLCKKESLVDLYI